MLPEQMVGTARNGWSASIGIDGRHSPDYAADLIRDEVVLVTNVQRALELGPGKAYDSREDMLASVIAGPSVPSSSGLHYPSRQVSLDYRQLVSSSRTIPTVEFEYKGWWIALGIYAVVLLIAFVFASSGQFENSEGLTILSIVWCGAIIPGGILLVEKGYQEVFREIFGWGCACSMVWIYGFWIVLTVLIMLSFLGPLVWLVALFLPERD